ncbi:hypothetical protein M8J76_009946 [Diaphorina citri]|nr:hypothetical protein M8J75_009862 [Diaphorina citri]KAI5709090.1 hypothetical protein M8J76_009946 [Diaphorina citri]
MQIKLWTSRNTLTFWTHPSVVEVTLQVYAALADRIPEAYDKYVGYIPILIQVFALSFVVLVVGYFTESRTYDILLRKEIMNRHQGETAAVTNQNRRFSATSLPGTYFEILQRVHFDGEAVQFSKNIRSVKTGVGPLVKVRKSNKVLRILPRGPFAENASGSSEAARHCSSQPNAALPLLSAR